MLTRLTLRSSGLRPDSHLWSRGSSDLSIHGHGANINHNRIPLLFSCMFTITSTVYGYPMTNGYSVMDTYDYDLCRTERFKVS